MSEFLGREYNFPVDDALRHVGGSAWKETEGEYAYFKAVTHAGEMAPELSLPSVDGREISLASLRGLPVVIEFGSLT